MKLNLLLRSSLSKTILLTYIINFDVLIKNGKDRSHYSNQIKVDKTIPLQQTNKSCLFHLVITIVQSVPVVSYLSIEASMINQGHNYPNTWKVKCSHVVLTPIFILSSHCLSYLHHNNNNNISIITDLNLSGLYTNKPIIPNYNSTKLHSFPRTFRKRNVTLVIHLQSFPYIPL